MSIDLIVLHLMLQILIIFLHKFLLNYQIKLLIRFSINLIQLICYLNSIILLFIITIVITTNFGTMIYCI